MTLIGGGERNDGDGGERWRWWTMTVMTVVQNTETSKNHNNNKTFFEAKGTYTWKSTHEQRDAGKPITAASTKIIYQMDTALLSTIGNTLPKHDGVL